MKKTKATPNFSTEKVNWNLGYKQEVRQKRGIVNRRGQAWWEVGATEKGVQGERPLVMRWLKGFQAWECLIFNHKLVAALKPPTVAPILL